MFDHVGVVFSDLKLGGDLYQPLLATLGIRLMEDHAQPDGTGWRAISTGHYCAFLIDFDGNNIEAGVYA